MSRFTDMLDASSKVFEEGYAELYNACEPLAHGAKSDDLNGVIDMYLRLEKIKDMCESLKKACNIHQPELAEIASKNMLATDTEAIVRGGYTIRPDTKTYVNVNKDDKPYVLMWLKNHPQGRELVSEDFNANALTAFVRGLTTEQGYSKDSQDEAKKLPAEISVFDKPVLTFRKTKK